MSTITLIHVTQVLAGIFLLLSGMSTILVNSQRDYALSTAADYVSTAAFILLSIALVAYFAIHENYMLSSVFGLLCLLLSSLFANVTLIKSAERRIKYESLTEADKTANEKKYRRISATWRDRRTLD